MTILDQITREAEALSTNERREALRLIRSLRPPTRKKIKGAKDSSMGSIEKRKLHPAVRAIAGMWKNRADLPQYPVLAVKALRSRMKSRGRND